MMDKKIKELIALLRQNEGNLTESGRERLQELKKDVSRIKKGG